VGPPPKLVARLAGIGRKAPGWPKGKPECRWDVDIVAHEVHKLSRYYGNCKIVVEDNYDRGLILLLKKWGANLYLRETFNNMEQRRTRVIGWNTNTQTRGMLVEAIAKSVREIGVEGSGLDVACPWMVEEMEHFVSKPSGRVEADEGHHDDQVIPLGIALCTIGEATALAQRRRLPKWVLDDLRDDSGMPGDDEQWT